MAREEEESEEYGGPYYEQPTLGDLTRGLSHERGETWSQEARGRVPPARMPGQGGGSPGQVADLAREQSIMRTTENERISKIAPALAFQVQSTYDARPIQAYDFQASGCDTISWIAGGSGSEFDPIEFAYMVPDNTIGVLRSFQYQVTGSPINAVTEGECWLSSTILINDLPIREYNLMFHPVNMLRPFEAFAIADERTEIKIRLQMGLLANGVDPVEFFGDLIGIETPILFRLYGNVILKTGIPKEFEIGNKIV